MKSRSDRDGIWRGSRRRRLSNAIAFAAVAVAGGFTPVEGQARLSDPEARALCWTPGRADRCGWFPISEISGAVRVSESGQVVQLPGGRSRRVTYGEAEEVLWALGLLRNLNMDWALGATISIAPLSDPELGSGDLRLRRWLSDDWSFDLDLGLSRAAIAGGDAVFGPRIGGRVGWKDYLSLWTRFQTTGYDRLSLSDGSTVDASGRLEAWFVGASVGREAGVLTTAGLLLGSLIYLGLLHDNN